MDEDQQNELQRRVESLEQDQQQLAAKFIGSQSGGDSETLTGVRRALNLYNFLDKKQDVSIERIQKIESTVAVANRNIDTQSKSFATNLTSINSSLITLEQGLKLVSEKLEMSDRLQKIKDANEKKRESQLAQEALREGKETLIEKKIQSALAAPVRKIGAKTRGVLANLLKFFNIALLGFMGLKSLQLLDALMSGNKKRIEEVKDKILKQLAIAGGIFVGINAGLAIALRSLVRLTAFAGRIAVTNLLFRPLQAIINLAKRGFFGAAAAGPSIGGPISTTSGVTPQGGVYRNGRRVLGSGRQMSANISGSVLVGTFASLNALLRGEELPEALAEGSARSIIYRGTQLAIGLIGAFFKVPPSILYPTSFLAPAVLDLVAGNTYGDALGDFGGSIIRQITGMDAAPVFDNLGQNVQMNQLRLRDEGDDVVVVNNNNESANASVNQIPNANTLMNMPSFNDDNPYISNSFIQYNVVLL